MNACDPVACPTSRALRASAGAAETAPTTTVSAATTETFSALRFIGRSYGRATGTARLTEAIRKFILTVSANLPS